MVAGKGEWEWSRTASILSMYYNAHRAKGGRAVSPEEFNPYRSRVAEVQELTMEQSLDMLRKVFVHEQGGNSSGQGSGSGHR